MGTGLDWSFLQYPYGVILATVWLYIVVAIYLRSGTKPSLKKLWGYFACTLVFAAAIILCAFRGAFCNVPLERSLIFCLVMAALATSTALAAGDDISRRQLSGAGPLFSHLGAALAIILLCCGSADKEKVRITAVQGQPVCMGTTPEGRPAMVPFMITLEDFSVEEYADHKPRRFCSTLDIRDRKGRERTESIEVNHPASLGSWNIYQAGHEGSQTSILECVRDPWEIPKTAVLVLLLAAGVAIAIRGLKMFSGRASLAVGAVALGALCFAYLIIFRHNLHKELPPALRCFWYVPHVSVYIVGYSALAGATVCAVVRLFRPDKAKAGAALARLGWGLLTLGMVMGALWAKQAWGDFWTWDPKESWAAATWLCWGLSFHIKGLKSRLWIEIISFTLLQMCWWGVNLLPQASSLHLYK